MCFIVHSCYNLLYWVSVLNIRGLSVYRLICCIWSFEIHWERRSLINSLISHTFCCIDVSSLWGELIRTNLRFEGNPSRNLSYLRVYEATFRRSYFRWVSIVDRCRECTRQQIPTWRENRLGVIWYDLQMCEHWHSRSACREVREAQLKPFEHVSERDKGYDGDEEWERVC